jgi:hypothetical protein
VAPPALPVLACRALDLLGVPELLEAAWRLLTRTSPLTAAEMAAAAGVLGTQALRYRQVRVAEGGLLPVVFACNGGRAFALFHTVNLPGSGLRVRANLGLLVHELVHVCQYERAGSGYIVEALWAQRHAGYDYGGPAGLRQARAAGLGFRHLNREQQAQLAQDYFRILAEHRPAGDYLPFAAELRRGEL